MKYIKLSAKSAKTITQNKLYIYILRSCTIIRKGNKKGKIVKVITMIYPITGGLKKRNMKIMV